MSPHRFPGALVAALLLVALAWLPVGAHEGEEAVQIIETGTPAGPYEVGLRGDRHLGEATFLIDVRQAGLAPEPGIRVTLELAPLGGDQPFQRVEAVSSGSFYFARGQIDRAGPWRARVVVEGAAGRGEAEGTFDVESESLASRLPLPLSLLVPLVAVVGLLLFLRVRGIPLFDPPA